jgi:hypothetical protein
MFETDSTGRSDETFRAVEREFARFGLAIVVFDRDEWGDLDPEPDERLWYATGWLPLGLDREIAVQPELLCDASSVLSPREFDRYLLGVALTAAFAAGLDCLPTTVTLDPESVVAGTVPGFLDLASRATAHVTWGTPVRPAERIVFAEVGLELDWSGYHGTIVEVRASSVLLQITSGPAIEVPSNDSVTVHGAMYRLVIIADPA